MSRKTLVKLIAASFALAGAQSALACSSTAWTNSGDTGGPLGGANLVVAEPDDATPSVRFAGRCGATSIATGAFHRDGSPAAEPAYRARFYLRAGLTAGEAVVFRAVDAANAPKVRVTFDSSNDSIKFYTGADNTADATVLTNNATNNGWFWVEINFSNATGSLRYTVSNATALLANDLPINTGIAPTDVIDRAELGWVADITAATGSITTDAFESRRNTAIGGLVRGDVNGNGSVTIGDATALVTEVNGGALAAGNAEVNFSGGVTIGDATAVVGIVNQ